MRLLLDTHILEWLVRAPALLKAREHAVIADPANVLLVSPVSIWEIRIKWEKWGSDGRRKGLLDPMIALSFIADSAIELTELSAADCAARLAPPLAHNDPFDQMLLIHAQRLGVKLLSRDAALAGHPLVVQL